MSETESKKPKRRWLRYSLRTLLLVVTLACVALGWKVNQARRQREAVAALRGLHAHLLYDYQLGDKYLERPPGPQWLQDWMGIDYFANVTQVRNVPMTNQNLELLTGFPYLEEVAFDGPKNADSKRLALLKNLRSLQRIEFWGVPFADDDLAHLVGLKGLKEIAFVDGKIHGPGLTKLASLNNLRILCLRGNPVTDEGLAALPDLPNLEELELRFTQITDETLRSLPRFPKLTWVAIACRGITREGVKELHEAMPRLKIDLSY